MRRAKENKLERQLPRQEPVVTLNRVIDAAQRHTPCEAMGCEEPVERVPGPVELERVTKDSRQRSIVDDETLILCESVDEVRILHSKFPDLGKELDLQQRDG